MDVLKQSILQHHFLQTPTHAIYPSIPNPSRSILTRTLSLTIRCYIPSHKTDGISDPSPKFSSVKSFAPATIANLGPGFNFLGCAIDGMGDTVTVTIDSAVPPGSLSISSISGFESEKLKLDPLWNCAGIAATAVMRMLSIRSVGLSISLEKGVPLGMGLGSSAASAAAAAYAVNELFGAPLYYKHLIPAGYESELKVSGLPADHIAPAIMGGFVWIVNYSPLDVFKILFPVTTKLFFVIATPQFESPMNRMRPPMPKHFGFYDITRSFNQLNGLVNAVFDGNVRLFGYMLSSEWLVEASLIPAMACVQRAALESGALGFAISGAGPTVVAVTDNKDKGKEIGARMVEAFWEEGKLKAWATVRKIDRVGARIISRSV
ncbi:homoserine kinase-like [Magnolia sinica]|uniref:homoserine kinase-like n=1 Tax=Magnolia sinica TaxID=86752 RepID=UPI002657C4CF|nr:homoserine kinase-like [Magnolia sinica]